MKNTKIKKIIAAIVALLLIGLLIYTALGLTGNPISKMIANNKAGKYVDKEYKDLDLRVEDAYYEFKNGQYIVAAKSNTSIDTHFEMNFTPTGKLAYDGYGDAVLKKWNTWERINKEYRDLVGTAIKESPSYEKDISFGEFIDVYSDYNHLEIDKKYDIKQMAKEEGKINIYIKSQNLDKETMIKALLEAKELFDKNDIPFNLIDITLEDPKEGEDTIVESISIRIFPYKDIYPEGLEKRVEENIKATKIIDEESLKEKNEEIEEAEEEEKKDKK